MAPWIWFVSALVLVALELVAPGGFWLLFLGLGAFVVGFLAATDLVQQDWIQWAAFSVVSVLGVLFLRKPLMGRFGKTSASAPIDALPGESAVVLDAVPEGGFGTAELRGTPWKARSASGASISSGTRARVLSVEGLTLVLEP